ncbi:MAG: hypothetical protein BGO33_05095 [Bacteroidia bacterium 43-41]|nr:MAG: hypothetical protein BGO33_05095 [Bacteroidia bacterium 43-41]
MSFSYHKIKHLFWLNLLSKFLGILYIDVRTAQEYAQGTINKAKLIDVSSADFEQKIEKLDKTCPVAVFCHSGARSMYAAKVLAKKGFSTVYNLKGGIVFWR